MNLHNYQVIIIKWQKLLYPGSCHFSEWCLRCYSHLLDSTL